MMGQSLIEKGLMFVLISLILAGCSVPSPQARPVSTAIGLVERTQLTIMTQPASSTVELLTPTELISATPNPSPTLQDTPTQEAIQITPIVTGRSEGLDNFSPDSRWLPYIDFNAQTLHFYDASTSSVCDFPALIHYTSPDRFIAWLPDGRVVVQAAKGVKTGLPCSSFTSAAPQEILVLDHADPSFSPNGRYRVGTQFLNNISQNSNMLITLKEVSSGKVELQTTIPALAGKSSPGFWLTADRYLIDEQCDQEGLLLLAPGKPVVHIAANIFHLPNKLGSGDYDCWMARAAVAQNESKFHLMLITIFGSSNGEASNPLQIYHSETGQVETLPYLVSQGAFSNNGRWLLVTETNNSGQHKVMIRPLDPAGGAFQLFSDQEFPPTWWSPDGSKYYQVSQDLTSISIYTSPDSTFLGEWQAPDYELTPSWSPDGKYLAVWGRKHSDFNQESIFVFPVPSQK
jgi:hypothetical protein